MLLFHVLLFSNGWFSLALSDYAFSFSDAQALNQTGSGPFCLS
jgi:hypothetical protein